MIGTLVVWTLAVLSGTAAIAIVGFLAAGFWVVAFGGRRPNVRRRRSRSRRGYEDAVSRQWQEDQRGRGDHE